MGGAELGNRRERGRGREGREREGSQVTVEPGPLRDSRCLTKDSKIGLICPG